MDVSFEELDENMMVVHLRGCINLETIEPFVNCLDKLRGHKVIFNMQDLSFVGSNGISTFVDSMRNLARASTKAIKFCGVGPEFRRIFTVTLAQDVEICEDIRCAQISFQPRAAEMPATSVRFHSFLNQSSSSPVSDQQGSSQPAQTLNPSIADGGSDQNDRGSSMESSVDSSASSSFIENPD